MSNLGMRVSIRLHSHSIHRDKEIQLRNITVIQYEKTIDMSLMLVTLESEIHDQDFAYHIDDIAEMQIVTEQAEQTHFIFSWRNGSYEPTSIKK